MFDFLGFSILIQGKDWSCSFRVFIIIMDRTVIYPWIISGYQVINLTSVKNRDSISVCCFWTDRTIIIIEGIKSHSSPYTYPVYFTVYRNHGPYRLPSEMRYGTESYSIKPTFYCHRRFQMPGAMLYILLPIRSLSIGKSLG